MKSFEQSLTDLIVFFDFDRCAKYIKALGFPKQYQLEADQPLDGDALRLYIVEEFRRLYKDYAQKVKNSEVVTVATGRFVYKMYYNEERGFDLYLGFVPLDADTCN